MTLIVVGISFSSYFIYISNERFIGDAEYAKEIPPESLIIDPVFYSYFDYLSQWHYNSMYVLNSYESVTFGGATSLNPLLVLLSEYRIVDFDYAAYLELRQKLWPEHWYKFNGYVAYSVFDYGYVLTICFSILYYFLVWYNRPIHSQITILKLFFLILLIQLPLMAIFYSNVGGIIMPLIYLIPIYLYLKIR